MHTLTLERQHDHFYGMCEQHWIVILFSVAFFFFLFVAKREERNENRIFLYMEEAKVKTETEANGNYTEQKKLHRHADVCH